MQKNDAKCHVVLYTLRRELKKDFKRNKTTTPVAESPHGHSSQRTGDTPYVGLEETLLVV